MPILEGPTKIGTVRKTYCFPAMNQRESGSIQGAILLSNVCPVVDLREIKCCKRTLQIKLYLLLTSFPHRYLLVTVVHECITQCHPFATLPAPAQGILK